MNNIVLMIILNILVWLIVVVSFIKSREIIYKMNAGLTFIIPIVFIVCGISQYIQTPNIYSLITALSLSIAGIVYWLIPSGICRNSFVIMGREYLFKDCHELKIEKANNKLQIRFIYKNKNLFLFDKLHNENELNGIIKKYYRR